MKIAHLMLAIGLSSFGNLLNQLFKFYSNFNEIFILFTISRINKKIDNLNYQRHFYLKNIAKFKFFERF